MTKISTLKDSVLNSKLYKSKAQKSFLVAVALSLTPLIIDSMSTDDSFQCPKKRGKIISTLLLFGPSVCISLLGLSHSIKFIREHENKSTRDLIRYTISRLFSVCLLMCVTLGSTLLLSEHYACLYMYGKQATTYTRRYLIGQSRQIGWLIIMAALIFVLIVAIMQLIFSRPTQLEKAFKIYISMQRKESRKSLQDALKRLSKRIIDKKLSQATESLKDFSDEEKDDSISDTLIEFKNEKKEIIRSKNNFKPQNMNLKEKFHYFSLNLDDILDSNYMF